MKAIEELILLHEAACTDPECDLTERLSDEQPTIEKVVQTLNDAFERDPLAMRLLLMNVVACNVVLADHPTIQVRQYDEGFTLSALGLLNGVLADLGLPLVASKWSEESDERGVHAFLGFQEYKP